MNRSASELIGLTLKAKRRVPMYRWATVSAPVLGYIEPGQTIGVIQSWISQKPGEPSFFWEFDDPRRGGLSTFYVPHIPGILDIPSLKESVLSRDEAERRRRLAWYERVIEDTTEAVTAGTSKLYTGALIIAGLWVVGKAISR